MNRFFAALSFLTRIPAPGAARFGAREVGRGALCFPLVGALVGAMTAGAASLLHGICPPWLAATLAVALMVLVTGAFHQDALADFVDGFGGGHTRQAVLRIMADSTIGAYGAVALILALVVRIGCTTFLLEAGAWDSLVVAAAMARWPSVLMGGALPYARADGKRLGQALTDHIGARECIGATVSALGIALLLQGANALWSVLACGVVTLWVSRLAMRRIGGVTGDTMGATTEACELAVLVLAVGSTA